MPPKAAPALFKQLNDALSGGEGEDLIKGTKVCVWGGREGCWVGFNAPLRPMRGRARAVPRGLSHSDSPRTCLHDLRHSYRIFRHCQP